MVNILDGILCSDWNWCFWRIKTNPNPGKCILVWVPTKAGPRLSVVPLRGDGRGPGGEDPGETAGNTPPRSMQRPVSVLEGCSCDISSPVLLAAPCTTQAASRAGDASGRDVRNRCWNHLRGRPRARGQAPTGFATACLSHKCKDHNFIYTTNKPCETNKSYAEKGDWEKTHWTVSSGGLWATAQTVGFFLFCLLYLLFCTFHFFYNEILCF